MIAGKVILILAIMAVTHFTNKEWRKERRNAPYYLGHELQHELDTWAEQMKNDTTWMYDSL